MKKIVFMITIPVWTAYLVFGAGWYIYTKDDFHLSALNDMVSWLLE